MLYITFAPACLASLGCSLACLLACLLDRSINSFIDGYEKFEIFTYIIFQKLHVFLYSYWSPVSVLFFYIRTDPLYRFYFSILWYTIVISTVLITWHAITWHRTPDAITCLLLVITWHLFNITYHLPPDILPFDLWLSYFENLVLLSFILYSDLYF